MGDGDRFGQVAVQASGSVSDWMKHFVVGSSATILNFEFYWLENHTLHEKSTAVNTHERDALAGGIRELIVAAGRTRRSSKCTSPSAAVGLIGPGVALGSLLHRRMLPLVRRSSRWWRSHSTLAENTGGDHRWPGWQVVVGIEVHAQVKSRKKLFSGEQCIPGYTSGSAFRLHLPRFLDE
jgi:hypothetical protein